MPERVAIIGASGLLGSWLRREFGRAEVMATGLSRTRGGLTRLDLTDNRATESLIRDFRPQILFLSAALSRPEACQADPDAAFALNAAPARLLAGLARKMGFRLVLISTDLVFDGAKGDYCEADPPAPLSIYGQSKVRAEEAVLEAGGDCLVVRVSLIVGCDIDGPAGTLAWMSRCQGAGKRMPLFIDEYRSPQSAPHLAQGLAVLGREAGPGIWHLAGPERLSRRELGRIICQVLGWDEGLIAPCRQADRPTDPPRARDVSLNLTKARTILGQERLLPLSQTLALACRPPAD
ncbi:MAG: SDR family oxidoreductase [Deltaproteobacteria bacterium]|nr:SDR family oxidoreductase [Deltaproteobacteria bacterium]